MSRLKIITNMAEVRELIEHCKTTGYASIDFETTSFKYYSDQDFPLILGVSFQPGSTWILPLQSKDSPLGDSWLKAFKLFGKEVISNYRIVKVAYNLKFEYKWFLKYTILMKGILFDPMLAKYLLDEERPHDLKSLVVNFFPKYAGYENEIKIADESDEGAMIKWQDLPFDKLCKYCGIDSDLTLRSMIYLEGRLIALGFYSLFRNLLMMITRVLAEAEFRGMHVDRTYLENLSKEYTAKIANSYSKLKNTPSVLRYEKKYLEFHKEKLIAAVQKEIDELEDNPNPPKTVDTLIRNRELKIARILEGKFQGKKEMYEGFNFGSPKQMGEFLFTSKFGLRLKVIKYTKNKKTNQLSDNPSTDEETLLALKSKDKSGFMDNLLEYRGLTKLDSTYVTGMLRVLHTTDRVHAGFLIHGTVTGRLSCKGPNLQNIPRGTTAADIKRMFIPPPGYLLVEVDYSQAELRIIAEVSGDKAMIDIFKRNYNIHVATACKMEGVGLDGYDKVKNILKKADVMSADELADPKNKEFLYWAKWKKRGKSMNFSIVYQQGDDATSQQMGISKEEAKAFKAAWYKQFPGVKKWIDKQQKFAVKNGYVMSMFGRKRRLYNVYSDNFAKKSEALRQAVNAPIQGGSGDFTLFSQVVIRDQQKRRLLPLEILEAYTVHDSIGFYMPPKIIHQVIPKIITICDNPETEAYFGFSLKDVKMKVSAEVGTHWAALKDYDSWANYEKLL